MTNVPTLTDLVDNQRRLVQDLQGRHDEHRDATTSERFNLQQLDTRKLADAIDKLSTLERLRNEMPTEALSSAEDA